MSEPMPVMTHIITADSGSAKKPMSALKPPTCIQV